MSRATAAMRSALHAIVAVWFAGLGARTLAAQDAGRVNIYRFILGVDVPESPALVAIGVAPTHVLPASAPKPVALSVLETISSGARMSGGVAIDFAPYFLAGGGARSLTSYRSMSIAGRLARVLTKTLFSVSAARDPAAPSASFVGLGIRSTFHDPHDVISSALPEEIADALVKAGVPAPGATEEELDNRGVDFNALFDRARRAMRRPTANPQVSGGWGMAAHLRGGVLNGDSVDTIRHCLWLSAQFTPDRRFDVLSTVELRSAFRSDRYFWVGVGLQRKTTTMNLLTELYYDTGAKGLYPGIAVDARILTHVGLVGSLTTQSAALATHGARLLELHTLVRWFYASDR